MIAKILSNFFSLDNADVNAYFISGNDACWKNGESAISDIRLLWTYKLAAGMEAKIGMKENASLYNARASQRLPGKIKVEYRNSGGQWNMQINVPKTISDSFI